MSNYFFGIDLGGTNFEIGLLDQDGKTVGHYSEPSQCELGPENVMDRMAAGCKKLLADTGISMDDVKALGIGSPGPMSISKGLIFNAGNLPGFINIRLRGDMSKRLGIPAVLENDANAAAWGEFWLGAGKNVTDMVMFTLGTGIGGGIICEGELIHGSEDNAAELGHMIIHPGGRKCSCGQNGCVEAHSSASSVARRANEALADGVESSLRELYKADGSVTCANVFDHAQQGDAYAMQLVDETARDLAIISINVLHITEPQMVVFTGGMIKAGDYLLDKIKAYFKEMLWVLKEESMQITYATLGGAAGYIGAAGLALHAFEQGKLPTVGE